MEKIGGLGADSITNIVMIVGVSVLILWYISIRASFDEVKQSSANLDILQDAINLACAYDELVLDSISLYGMTANISIHSQDVCIKSQESAELCVNVICPAIADIKIDLNEKNIINVRKTAGGYSIE